MPIRRIFISLCLLFPVSLGMVPLAAAQDTRVIGGGSDTRLTIADGYDVDVFARRLGNIADMVRAPDGTLIVADQEAGRIFQIEDRRMDGRADMSRALAQRFDRPTGLAFIGDTLFVADRGGLWQVNPAGGSPRLVAPFARSGSMGSPHPLVALPNGQLRLAQTLPDNRTRVLDLDPNTGIATLVEQGEGSVIAFSRSASPSETPLPPWPIIRRTDGLWFGPTLTSARKLKMAARHVWIDVAQSALIISATDGIHRAPALLGGIGAVTRTYLGGFETRTGQIGRGSPGPIIMDERGIFVADMDAGRIWRIHKAEAAPVIEPEPDPESEGETERPPRRKTPEELLLRGSSLNNISEVDGSPTPINPRGTEITDPDDDQPEQ